MYSVADALLRWDEISLQRDLFEKATYTAYTLYTLCTERVNRNESRNSKKTCISVQQQCPNQEHLSTACEG